MNGFRNGSGWLTNPGAPDSAACRAQCGRDRIGIVLLRNALHGSVPRGSNTLPKDSARIQSTRMRRMARKSLPKVGNPNTSRVKRDKDGKIIQRRFYGGD